jgi:hypothetical protein
MIISWYRKKYMGLDLFELKLGTIGKEDIP